MKSYNKLIIGLAICTSLVCIGAQSSFAVVCNSGTLNQVGVYPNLASDVASPYFVKLTCNDTNATWTGKGSRQYVIAKGVVETSIYATALTAIASGKNVSAIVASTAANSLLTKLTIINQ